MALHSTDIIELLSDDSSSADDSEHGRRHQHTARPNTTPARSALSSGRAAAVATPETPDLPSPRTLLGAAASRPSSGVGLSASPTRRSAGIRSGLTRTASRQAALDLPSSPPLADVDANNEWTVDGDQSLILLSPRSNGKSGHFRPLLDSDGSDGHFQPLLNSDGGEEDDCLILDEIIEAQQEQLPPSSSDGWSDLLGFGVSGGQRVFGRLSTAARGPALPEFSDAVATEILGSSSSSEASDLESDDVLSARAKDLLARASALTQSLRKNAPRAQADSLAFSRRALSAGDDPVSVSTLDTSPLPSQLHRHATNPARLPGSEGDSSSSIPAVWQAECSWGEAVPRSRLATSKEKQPKRSTTKDKSKAAADKAAAHEKKRQEREQREREREFAKNVSLVNRKTLDPKVLIKDMTLVVDPDVLAQVTPKRGKKQGRAQSASGTSLPDDADADAMGDDVNQHAMFAKLAEEGVPFRIDDGGTPRTVCWEMCLRRRWDSRMGLFMPVEPPQTVRVKRAAMVVLTAARFVELVVQERLAGLLASWRVSLAVSRLFVTVLGLQQLLRKAASVESREFARQMRTYIRAGTVGESSTAGSQRSGSRTQDDAGDSVSEEAVEEAVLRLQMTCPWVSWFLQCADSPQALGQLLWQTTLDLALVESNEREGDNGGSEQPSERLPGVTDTPREQGFITGDVASALRVAVVKSGADLTDSWLRALTQIPKVTQPVAQGIVSKYPTPQTLFAAWEQQVDSEKREQLLANITVASAASTGRRLGSVVSARIYHVFNENDPSRLFAEI